MIKIGIFACNTNQVDALCEIIEDYVHCPPYRKLKGMVLFRLPLIEITILIGNSNARGYKYDILYYDTQIDDTLLHEILYPCCPYGRPLPLRVFLDKLK